MRKKIVAGNWKMNGSIEQVTLLSETLKKELDNCTSTQVVVIPPSIYLPLVSATLKDSPIKVGAQNVYPKDFGAYTGELSAPMLKDYNCSYVLVGHSERRHYFDENEKFVAQKFHHAKEHDIIPILCVGETLEEREQGKTQEVIEQQLLAVLYMGDRSFTDCVVAYEPVWAIGTGKTASPDQAQEIHQFIRGLVAKVNNSDAENLCILYGGSVNENNAKALFSMPDIDGGLVGGASLNATQFVDIVQCTNLF